MTRLFDRQLAQPEPPSLYDLLQIFQHGDDSATAMKARRMLASPEVARLVRTVRSGGTGLLVREVQGARVIAAEAVHRQVGSTPAPALFARLRERSVLPQHDVAFIEVQKLRSMASLTAFGWLVTTHSTANGYAMQAYLSTEWGRGKLFSPLAVCYFDLDSQGRYRCEDGTDGPAVEFSTPDDPQRPGLIPRFVDPIARSLMATVGTLLATLAVVAESPHLPQTVPDKAQSAAYQRRAGRALVTYRRIPPEATALQELFLGLETAP